MACCPVLDRPRITAIAETDLPRRPGPKLHLARVTARAGRSTAGAIVGRPGLAHAAGHGAGQCPRPAAG
jgi:hypothetical protein